MMEMSATSFEKHVAVLAFPFGCHALSLLNLVMKLASSSPPTTRFTFFNTRESNTRISSSLASTLPENVKLHDMADDGESSGCASAEDPIEKVEMFLRSTPENFIRSLEFAAGETGQKITCLIADAFLSFAAGTMADSLAVAWIAVWIPAPLSLSAHIHTDAIRRRIQDSNGGAEPVDFDEIPGFSKIRIEDLPDEVWSAHGTETMFSCMLTKMAKELPRADAFVINFYDELYPIPLLADLKCKFPNLLNVGFVTLQMPPPLLAPAARDDDTGCLAWLDAQKPKSVAYVSFGTVVNIPDGEMSELANALESSGIPFLWSIRTNLQHKLPDGFREKIKFTGRVVAWAPQTLVLGHTSIAVFLTHCGANSVYESLANGVPMICRPVFGDNRMNCRIIEEVWGIGVRVEGGVFTKNGVARSLKHVMEDEQGAEIRPRMEALRNLVLGAASPVGSESYFEIHNYEEVGIAKETPIPPGKSFHC